MNNRIYSVVIIDDENPARVLLKEYLDKIPNMKLLGNFPNPVEAMTLLSSQKVDILLTDIQMPDIHGVDLVKNLNQSLTVIFTTAYSQYAIEGFNLDVADYLLKPIAFPRFAQAIQKAVQRVEMKDIAENSLTKTENSNPISNFILIKADYKIYKVNYDDLFYIEGQHEYVTFHTVNHNITAYYNLKDLENELSASHFIRSHKSYIISLKYIEYIENNFVFVKGSKLPIGATYKNKLLDVMNNTNTTNSLHY
jgi:DNA-binding LytR/AlgR family response regulator